VAAIVLAAGDSSRFGSPKPLARFRGSTLLARTVACAAAAGCAPIVVVVGGDGEAVEREARAAGAATAWNPAWQTGPGSSIRAGVAAARRATRETAGFLLLASDQPLLTADVLRALVAAFDGTPGRVVAAAYAGTVGVPALFEASLAPELEALPAERGAKGLLLRNPGRLVRVPWDDGAVDADRPEDLDRLAL
jgi:molybdenum cofactor cytidylyltransferase